MSNDIYTTGSHYYSYFQQPLLQQLKAFKLLHTKEREVVIACAFVQCSITSQAKSKSFSLRRHHCHHSLHTVISIILDNCSSLCQFSTLNVSYQKSSLAGVG